MTEQELIIEGCKQNNRKSQEKLYMQFYPALSGLCRRFFDDEQEIISALNNGMLRIFKNIAMYDKEKSALLTWMYTIVRNEALTMVRNKKTTLVTQELTSDLTVEVMSNPFIKKEEEEIYIYLGKLSHTTRATCSLYYIEGYSVKEIAISLDMKEGTVKWHLSEGRKRIQSLFKTNSDRIANAG